MRLYAMQSGEGEDSYGTHMFPLDYTLMVNTHAPLIQKLAGLCDTDGEKAEAIASQVYNLSVLAQRKFTASELKAFLSSSFDLLNKM